MPDSTAQFVHDPNGGDTPAQRLTLISMPEKPPRMSVGGLSGKQQAEELAQLQALAGAGGAAAPSATAAPAAPADPVDKLAAWLLSQADLSE